MAPPPKGPITTPLTTLLGMQHPILLAGMARTSGAALAAAVSNAGGLGVIGGFMYTPEQLREIVAELKTLLASPDLPFGIDLALPQVGGQARKTNHDYTGGRLEELIDITIESGMFSLSLSVCVRVWLFVWVWMLGWCQSDNITNSTTFPHAPKQRLAKPRRRHNG